MSVEAPNQTNKGKKFECFQRNKIFNKINVYFFDFVCFVGSTLYCYNTTNKTE